MSEICAPGIEGVGKALKLPSGRSRVPSPRGADLKPASPRDRAPGQACAFCLTTLQAARLCRLLSGMMAG